MLQDGDLKAFINVFERSKDPNLVAASPRGVLAKEDGLFASEIWRLLCSLRIAAALGDAPHEAGLAARLVLDEIRDLRCAPFEDHEAWTRAVAWARAQPAFAEAIFPDAPRGREREAVVGAACLRLRTQGYKIEVGAYGPRIAEASRREIVRSAEAFVALLGGYETASRVLRFLRDANLYHDGMWLFGEVGLNLYDAKRPMIPVGWLFSLALRHLGDRAIARKPEVAWKSLTDLTTDFAAAHDCQRYSQFEGFDLHPSQFHRTLVDSALWREFFALPQVPPKGLHQILEAIATIITRDDEERLGFAFRTLVNEVHKLVNWSADDRLTIYPRARIEQALPLSHRITGGAKEAVNVGYGDPLAAGARTQDRVLLFAYGSDRVIALPRALLAAAACEHVFWLVWSKLDAKRAAEIVGRTLECAIAKSCEGKASKILTNEKYLVHRRVYELDVAILDEDRIVLIETKGKSLTQRSRSGDMFAFIQDYSDSFLAMVAQLVRHELHLKQGHLPLMTSGGTIANLRPVKVAVSPLSYGPVSDKFLSRSILRSLITAKLFLVEHDPEKQKIIDTFNERIARIAADIASIAPKKDGLVQLSPYLIDIFWLDLGQFLYILDRANTFWDAFSPLSHITFTSRDFWTELANADRGGLTRGKWRPVQQRPARNIT